jgi:MFS-type transporter involved in bile tolerance (Atg22 family)
VPTLFRIIFTCVIFIINLLLNLFFIIRTYFGVILVIFNISHVTFDTVRVFENFNLEIYLTNKNLFLIRSQKMNLILDI